MSNDESRDKLVLDLVECLARPGCAIKAIELVKEFEKTTEERIIRFLRQHPSGRHRLLQVQDVLDLVSNAIERGDHRMTRHDFEEDGA